MTQPQDRETPEIVSRSRTPFAPGGALLAPTDTYRAAPVRWLWHPRAPVGKVTLLAGDPGPPTSDPQPPRPAGARGLRGQGGGVRGG